MKLKQFTVLLIALFGIIAIYFLFNIEESGVIYQQKPVKIYYVDNISDAHQEIIDNFNRLHSGKIEVIPIDIPFYKFSTNERKELLIRSLRSESKRIDIFAADLIWVNRFAKWAEPLEKYFSQDEIEALLPKALETGKIENHIVASPLYLDVSVLFYRTDLLKKFHNYRDIESELKKSITWEKFEALHRKSDFKDNFYYFPADEYEGLICSFAELVESQDTAFFKLNKPLTSKPAINAAKLLHDLTNKYKMSPKSVVNFREKNAYKAFIDNNGLFLRGWQSFMNDSKNLDKSSGKDFLLAEARLPHLKGARIGGTLGGWNIMLAQNSSHKKEAVEFIKFTLTEESQKILFEKGSYLPVIKSLYSDSLLIKKHPNFEFNKHLLDEGFFRQKLPDYTKISDILSHYLRLTIAGKISPETAMKKAAAEINLSRTKR